MSWSSVGDFNTLIEAGVRTNCLESFGGHLYVGLSNGAIWRYDGIDWEESFAGGFASYPMALLSYDGELYAGMFNSFADNALILKFDSFTWDQDLSANSESTFQLVEHDGDLYFCTAAILWQDEGRQSFEQFQGKVYRKSGGVGSWVELSSTEENAFTLATYQAALYLSGRTGNNTEGINYIQEFGGANVFTEGVGGTLEFQDFFTDTNGTTITAHTPDLGGAWFSLLNDGEIQGNEVRAVNDTTPFVVVTDITEADGVIMCLIAPGNDSSNYQGVVARVQNINNLWYFIYAEGGISPDTNSSIYIIERNGGVDTIRASAITDLQTTFGEDYYFRIELSGNDMAFMVVNTGVVSGGEHDKISYTSSFLATETTHGITIGESLFDARIDSFLFTGGTIDTWHCQARRMLEFGTHLYSYDARYIHQWSGVSWVLDHTFAFDEISQWGRRDLIEYDSKLWAGAGTSIWVRDGGTWTEDPDSDVGYSDESIPTNMYSPPVGFAIYNGALYVCGGPGEVFVREGIVPTGGNVRGIAIAKSKSADERIWVTLWKPTFNALYLRAYDATTLTPEVEYFLSNATAAQVNAGSVIAYPYTPPNGISGEVYVFGRFFYQPAVTHMMHTLNAGVDFTIIEDQWNTDVCGAMVHRGNQIYAVRNKPTLGHLYKGTNSLGFVSVMGCPVNPYAFNITPNLNVLFAGNKTPGTPRIIAASYPFVNWVDVTLNYPHNGRVKAITSL